MTVACDAFSKHEITVLQKNRGKKNNYALDSIYRELSLSLKYDPFNNKNNLIR